VCVWSAAGDRNFFGPSAASATSYVPLQHMCTHLNLLEQQLCSHYCLLATHGITQGSGYTGVRESQIGDDLLSVLLAIAGTDCE